MALLDGHVAEMATGEGKTLSGALAAVGYALRGQRVHVSRVNDYLARRDAEWMRPLYDLLGVKSAGSATESRRRNGARLRRTSPTLRSASSVSTCCGTGSPPTSTELVVAEPNVAIIDEADSVLVDEALVPLVLAGTADRTKPTRHGRAGAPAASRHATTRSTTTGATSTSPTPAINVVEKALGGVDLYSAEHIDTALAGSTWRCTPTCCSTATCTTSCGTARCSSSTSPAAVSRSSSAGPTACRPRWKPRST